MEENQHIDNLFRSAIEPAEIAPPEKSWNAIDEQLDRAASKRKSGNRWFLFGIMAVLLSAGELIYVLEIPNPLPNVASSISSATNPQLLNPKPKPAAEKEATRTISHEN